MKKYVFCMFFLVFVIFVRLFLGVYEEPEFSEQRLFLKHKPSLHWYFPVPEGEHYPFIENLTDLPEHHNDKNEKLYIEFVNQGGGNKRSIFFVPSIWNERIFN